MKITNSIILLLVSLFCINNFSCNSTNKPHLLNNQTQNNLKKYVGEYIYEAAGIPINIYTKEKENNSKLYLFVTGDKESELIKIGEHKFSFKTEKEFNVEFKNLENGVFNELILIQPQGNVKAVRKEKAIVKIDDLTTIDKKLNQKGFSGVILVAKNDSIIFNKAYGKKNNQENGFNDINTVFDICSITKQFTAAAILKLSKLNKLSVTDKLSKYFGNVPKNKENITIHHLLTHSSGLKSDVGNDYDAITEEKFLKKVFRSKLLNPVGEKFNYSNLGYSLLGLIIEKVSGLDYESFLNTEIFEPSKMYHTGYIIPNWKNNEVANGFLDGAIAKKPNEENWSKKGPYLNLKANGGILSNANDMFLWSKAIRDNLVLDASTTSKYLQPHLKTESLYSSYGYGWGIENNDSENKLVLHGGASDLFASDMWMYPKKGITIIVLSNTQEAYIYSIARKISNFIIQK